MHKTISIVEDNALFQQALVDVIRSDRAFALGEVYGSAEAAMDMLKNPPDIAIVDINLPGKSGIELIAQLQANAAIQCLVCSLHDDDDHIMRALESGAVGYILKDSTVGQISNALHELVKGGAPMSPYIANRVISFFRKPKIREESALLSVREREVLQLLAKGLQYKEIADQLFLSTETVKKHMKNIYQKLHVQNKVEAINKFRFM
ncbi:response regulator transcription factor [Flavisolibacter nicotianae]|uniref:response regulator transcription factor n=1 Tax=Flavisolibacter nicotianae TaxID=2364882 RepID=UPI000EB479F8|nr:response regulator transcription factor [Flavisolibacter nicotianae]